MNQKLKNDIIQYLKESKMVDTWEEVIETETEVVSNVSLDDESEIAETSTGLKYNKEMAIAYLREKGTPLTIKNLEMVAIKFSDQKYTVRDVKKVVYSDIDEIDDDEVQSVLLFNLLKERRKNANDDRDAEYEYKIECIKDTGKGYMPKEDAQIMLNNYSEQGWRLISVHTSEGGKNVLAYSGVTNNSAPDYTYFFFERRKK